jgi:hypothetical protein
MASPGSNPGSACPGKVFPSERTSNEEKGERPRRKDMNECTILYECDYEYMIKRK